MLILLQIKLKNKTPANRLATRINFFDNKLRKLQKIKHSTFNFTKKCFKYVVNTSVSIKHYNATPIVINDFFYNYTPYNLVLLAKNIYNNEYKWPGIAFLNPGRKCYIFTTDLFQKTFKKFLGSCFSLENIPYNFDICYIRNVLNNRWSYIKSSGLSGTKLKTKKHIKLISVKLPSQLNVFFTSKTLGFIGSVFNFFTHKQIEGKWGYSFKKAKNINVRGVAMNPVDHPNGGRTKAKQPEKTPWGWVAKNNK